MFELLWLSPSPTPVPDTSSGINTLSADTILTAIIALVTLAGVVGSIWIATIGQKQGQVLARGELERAEKAQAASEASAERAEAAAALNIDALTRVADALERPIANALAIAAQAAKQRLQLAPGSTTGIPFANPARVKWSLRHFQGDKYILENVGDATAHNVVLSAHETLLGPNEWPKEKRIGPGEVLTFMAVRTLGTVDSAITVKWNPTEEPHDEGTWRYPLPPRPPR